MTQNELWDKLIELSKEIGKCPSIQQFSEYTKLKKPLLSKIFRNWERQGKLIRHGNYFNFTEPSEEHPVIKTLKKTRSFPFMKFIIGMIGFILTLCSIYLTFKFQKLSMPPVWAFLLSLSIVMFMTFAFALRSYIPRKHTKFAIVVLWCLGISYSVFTAVSGQFNEFKKYSVADNSSVIINQNKIYESQLERLIKKQKELNHWRIEEEKYTENVELKTENPSTWKRIQNGVYELNEVELKIEEVQNKMLENVSDSNSEHETVYSWLSSIFKISASWIQFIVTLFPALFIDLCSSVCMAFTFGKKDGN